MMQKVTPAEVLGAFDADEQQYGFAATPEDEADVQHRQQQQYYESTVY
jgi:hypothetical protein